MSEYIIHISEGKIVNRITVRKAFEGLSDGRYSLKIESANKRTLPQNAYLHSVIIPLVFQGLRDAGFGDVKNVADAKKVIKALFLKRKIINENTGELVAEIIKDTHELTTIEMNEFIEDVIRWGAEYLSIQIPYPNEQLTLV